MSLKAIVINQGSVKENCFFIISFHQTLLYFDKELITLFLPLLTLNSEVKILFLSNSILLKKDTLRRISSIRPIVSQKLSINSDLNKRLNIKSLSEKAYLLHSNRLQRNAYS